MTTTLTHWEPFAEIADLRGRFDRMLNEIGGAKQQDWMPAIDMVRDGDSLVLRADVPGIKPEDVKIEVENDRLTISGQHEEETTHEDKDYVRRERRFGAFTRSTTLPQGVDATEIVATTHDGVLEVTIPLPKEAKTDKVEIKASAA